MPKHSPPYDLAVHDRCASETRKGGNFRLTASSLLTALVAIFLMGSTWRELAGTENLVAILGYQITIAEPILVVLFLISATVVAEGKVAKSNLLAASLIFLAIFSISLLRGCLVDPEKALFFARLYIITPIALIIALSIRLRHIDIKSILNVILFFGYVLSAILFFKYISGFLIVDAHHRALFTWGAFVIVSSFFLSIIYGREISLNRYPNATATIFFIAIVLSGQGTALVATILIALMLFATGGGRGLPRSVRLIIVVLALAAVLTLGPTLMADLSERSSLADWAEQRAGTSGARQLVWTAFLDSFGTRLRWY